MRIISWEMYWSVVGVLASLYYIAVYIIFFKRNVKKKTDTDEVFIYKKETAAQRKEESNIS